MNLRDLEYAVCLAGEGQFRRAATRCHVSQPTLSAQIAKLEDELGVQLNVERSASFLFSQKSKPRGSSLVSRCLQYFLGNKRANSGSHRV